MLYVNFRKLFSTFELSQNFLNKGYKILIFFGDDIEDWIFKTKSDSSIWIVKRVMENK